jgi:CxxC motif-containing protein (DUF1111 family)
MVLAALAGCDGSSQGPSSTQASAGPARGAPPASAVVGPQRHLAGGQLGDPLPGLTPAELDAFQRGKVLFEKRFKPEEGLGPHYNATSCASCHSTPTTGGSAQLYRNFFIAMYGTPPSQSAFPSLPSPVVPAYGPHTPGAAGFTLEQGRFDIPATYFGTPVVVAQRNAIPLFGVGLFEFIDNQTILLNADPFDLDNDGISGRANYDFGDLGRFGVKAQSNNIERFTRPPLFNQMGVTSDPFLGSAGTISLSSAAQGTTDPDAPITDLDGVPDPEMTVTDLGDLIAFSRFLAPPPRLPFSDAAMKGEALFAQIGCVGCHLPTLNSTLGPVEAHTDLLLHDMGLGLADNLQFGAPSPGGPSTATEFRTQPLWGVSLHAPFLHDGRAATLAEAIDAHGGEAQASRDKFTTLSPKEQAELITFLEHL